MANHGVDFIFETSAILVIDNLTTSKMPGTCGHGLFGRTNGRVPRQLAGFLDWGHLPDSNPLLFISRPSRALRALASSRALIAQNKVRSSPFSMRKKVNLYPPQLLSTGRARGFLSTWSDPLKLQMSRDFISRTAANHDSSDPSSFYLFP